jgi:hypothetical protein
MLRSHPRTIMALMLSAAVLIFIALGWECVITL